jgi:hypothetical protein
MVIGGLLMPALWVRPALRTTSQGWGALLGVGFFLQAEYFASTYLSLRYGLSDLVSAGRPSFLRQKRAWDHRQYFLRPAGCDHFHLPDHAGDRDFAHHLSCRPWMHAKAHENKSEETSNVKKKTPALTSQAMLKSPSMARLQRTKRVRRKARIAAMPQIKLRKACGRFSDWTKFRFPPSIFARQHAASGASCLG